MTQPTRWTLESAPVLFACIGSAVVPLAFFTFFPVRPDNLDAFYCMFVLPLMLSIVRCFVYFMILSCGPVQWQSHHELQRFIGLLTWSLSSCLSAWRTVSLMILTGMSGQPAALFIEHVAVLGFDFAIVICETRCPFALRWVSEVSWTTNEETPVPEVAAEARIEAVTNKAFCNCRYEAICTICLDDISHVEHADSPSPCRAVGKLPCGHIFHDDCIRKWFHIDKRQRCPTCWVGAV